MKDGQAPNPNEMQRRANKAALKLLKDFGGVREEYAWVHNYAYSEDHRGRDIDSKGKNRGDPSDRTGDVVAQKAKRKARSRLERAAEMLAELDAHIGAELKGMRSLLSSAIEDRDIGPQGLYPRTVTREDSANAKVAQERRRERGEAVP